MIFCLMMSHLTNFHCKMQLCTPLKHFVAWANSLAGKSQPSSGLVFPINQNFPQPIPQPCMATSLKEMRQSVIKTPIPPQVNQQFPTLILTILKGDKPPINGWSPIVPIDSDPSTTSQHKAPNENDQPPLTIGMVVNQHYLV